MRTDTTDAVNELTLAEASAWLVRLHAPERDAMVDAAFREWLGANRANARAFARVNDVWDILPGAAFAADAPIDRPVRRRRRGTRWFAAAACMAVMLAIAGFFLLRPRDQVYQTAVGAQRTIVLEDHTRLTLNTDTRVVVAFRRGERRVRLERGEALFQVTPNAGRPFVVQAGDTRIRDIGTTFDVNLDPDKTAVTLIEGEVQVSSEASSGGAQPSTTLNPGERLTVYARGNSVLDKRNASEALAWRFGRLYFDDTSLADAVAEMNRYGGPPIRVGDPMLAALRISGVFSTHDPHEFALAVASLHHLQTSNMDGAIVLTR